MEFLEIRCRCKHKNIPKLDCWSILGGPSLDTLRRYDFEKGPFVDMRYCINCQRMVKITIKNFDEIPIIEAVPKAERVSFKKIEDIFGFVKVKR